MTDASDTAVGAVLQQYKDDTWHLIYLFSRKMTPTEQRYNAFDRELLAVYIAIRHFRHFLKGRQFHVLTENKPLAYALGTRRVRHSPRQARQLDYISQFISSVRHVHGHDNVAGTLSRIESNSLMSNQPPVVDFTAMAQSQSTDSQIRKWRRTVFHSLHGLFHSGIRATHKLITSLFVWPGINADDRRWTRLCVQCQRAKVQRHFRTPPFSFPVPDARFDISHIDLIGPLPPS